MQAESPFPSDTANRILDAAGSVFAERGLAVATTLAIATRAHVSKHTLYKLFGSKTGLLLALILRRTELMKAPLLLAEPPRSTDELAAALRLFGTTFLPLVCAPNVVRVMRLAIADAERAPELARQMQTHGREPVGRAMQSLLQSAVDNGVIPPGLIGLMIETYFGVLQGGVSMPLLLGLRSAPGREEIADRAALATRAALAVAAMAP